RLPDGVDVCEPGKSALRRMRQGGLCFLVSLMALCPRSAELSGSFAPVTSGSVINLSAESNLDWAHWGNNPTNIYDHKSGVVAQISNVSTIGTSQFVSYNTNLVGYTWTNGTPTLLASNSTTGIVITGLNNGFALTVPADTIQR